MIDQEEFDILRKRVERLESIIFPSANLKKQTPPLSDYQLLAQKTHYSSGIHYEMFVKTSLLEADEAEQKKQVGEDGALFRVTYEDGEIHLVKPTAVEIEKENLFTLSLGYRQQIWGIDQLSIPIILELAKTLEKRSIFPERGIKKSFLTISALPS